MKKRILKFLAILTTVFILGPILTFLHELGHATIPVLNGKNVKIVMGIDSFNLFSLNICSLEIIWNNTLLPWIGYTKFNEPSSWAYILGPTISLSLFVLLRFFLFKIINNEFLQRVTYSSSYWCLYQGIFTIVPLKYPNWLKGYENFTSDGMKFLQSIL